MKIDQIKFKERAQTASELAIFGSILIFVLGMIVNQTVGFSYAQNHYLRAMRLAMKISYLYSEGLVKDTNGEYIDKNGSGSRNNATVLLIEDRLTVDSGKYGAVDRAPQIINVSASHSRHFFEPFEDGDEEDAAIVDVFVNGKHFPLTTGRFKRVCLAETIEKCKYNDDGITPNGWDEWSPNSWDSECAEVASAVGVFYDYEAFGVWSCAYDATPEIVGCKNLYSVITNHPNSEDWCDGRDVISPCLTNLSANERFDLDRDGVTDVPEDPNDPQAEAIRQQFSWQWFRIKGINLLETSENPDDRCRPIVTLGPGEEGMIFDSDLEIDAKNILVDVDGDLKEEMIVKNSDTDSNAVMKNVTVWDSQDGDMDLTISDQETDKVRPGFTQDLVMYTRVKSPDINEAESGTYLRIEQGKICNPSGDKQCYRSVQKNDHVDIVERALQLSNNTNRFCQVIVDEENKEVRLDKDDGNDPLPTTVDGLPNPVEVCCDAEICEPGGVTVPGEEEGGTCFDKYNIDKTCMFVGTWYDHDDDDNASTPEKFFPPTIFVRSRIKDAHGRMWVTDTSDDPYVEFK